MKRPIVITLLVIALVLVLAGIGAVVFFTTGIGGNFFAEQMQGYATLEESKSLKVDADEPITLNVQNGAGSVTVVGADVTAVDVDVVKTAYAPTQARADEEVKDIKYDIRQDGNSITLTYKVPKAQTNMPNVTVINPDVDTVDFVVTVPNETVVDIESSLGQVSVSNILGNVEIANDFGEVTVENIEGALTVETQSGQVEGISVDAGNEDIQLASGFGTVRLEQANGKDILLDSSSGALEMYDVRASGDIEMTTDFGDALFSGGSAKALTVGTQSGKVTLSQLNLSGALRVDDEFGNIDLEQVSADSYDLQTSSGAVTVDGAQGNVKAHSGFGSVTLTNAENVTVDLRTQSGSVDFEGSLGEGPHTLQSDFGEIQLTIPADSALNVDLTTDFGTIRSDIPITVTLSGNTEQNHQSGTMNEGGGQLTVKTGSGGISIQASN